MVLPANSTKYQMAINGVQQHGVTIRTDDFSRRHRTLA